MLTFELSNSCYTRPPVVVTLFCFDILVNNRGEADSVPLFASKTEDSCFEIIVGAAILFEFELDATTAGWANLFARWERGPESMFRRVQIFDASGNMLENIDHYNELYALTELCTNNYANRTSFLRSHGEGKR